MRSPEAAARLLRAGAAIPRAWPRDDPVRRGAFSSQNRTRVEKTIEPRQRLEPFQFARKQLQPVVGIYKSPVVSIDREHDEIRSPPSPEGGRGFRSGRIPSRSRLIERNDQPAA